MTESPVFFHSGDDPKIIEASTNARSSFRYFWYQAASDFNRIFPALEMACVKAPFTDEPSDENSPVEQMWVDQIFFDGIQITGTLINSPGMLRFISQGDKVAFPVSRISDWLCVINEHVYGGHTIQVIRSRMTDKERAGHDQAWGLDFPPPDSVLIPERSEEFEENIASLIRDQIAEDPATVNAIFDEGRTILHLEALYGRAPTVQVLLAHGADPAAQCNRGWTAREYASSLQWDHVISLLDQEA